MSQPYSTPSLGRKGFPILRALRSRFPGLLALAIAAACSQTAAPPQGAPSSTGQPAATATFPTTVRDDDGTAIELRRPAERIVSLSPANTETVFALGKGANVLAGSAFDDYPPEARPLPDVATFDQGVLVERVVELRPDLVLASGNNFTPVKDIERLRKLGITVVVLYAETVDEVLADIRLIGLTIGAAGAAKEMTDAMSGRIDSIRAAAAATGTRPRVFYEIGDQPDLYGPADDSFVADLIQFAGGEPVTTGSTTSFTMPLERLVSADPEVIVLGDANYGVTVDTVRKRPGAWRSISAVESGRIVPVDDIIVTRPGPRMAEGLAQLARAVHPEIALPNGVGSPSPSATASG